MASLDHFSFPFSRHPWSFITVKGNPSSSVEDHVEYQGNSCTKCWLDIISGSFWSYG